MVKVANSIFVMLSVCRKITQNIAVATFRLELWNIFAFLPRSTEMPSKDADGARPIYKKK